MRITDARFLKSAMHPNDYPKDGKPEFAFVGRSNVGKSSLMNVLMGRKGLAKTSATPGKTQTLNWFDINGSLYFVDLPGYGYAKVPVAVKNEWNRVLSSYLAAREPLRLVVLLLDARHKPTQGDLDMLALLDEAEVPTLITATKMDKLNRNERKKNLDRIRQTLELEDDALILPFSATTGEGRKELLDVLGDLV